MSAPIITMTRIRLLPTSMLAHQNVPIDEFKVQLYREMLRSGSRQPPLRGKELPDGRFEISDGNHRLKALSLEGRSFAEVIVGVGW
jgi:ParB-like chromosome segregation protein Spo0J